MMRCEPVAVYGTIAECDDNGALKRLRPEALRRYGVEEFATEVSHGRARGLIYGVRASTEGLMLVDPEARRAAEALARDLGFGEPRLLMALAGDYEVGAAYLNLAEEDGEEEKRKRWDEDYGRHSISDSSDDDPSLFAALSPPRRGGC